MVAIVACPVGSAHEAAPAQHFPVQGRDKASWLTGRWRSWRRCGRAIPVLFLKIKVPEFCVFDTGSAQPRSLNLLHSSLISALPWKGGHCNQNVEGKKLQIKLHIQIYLAFLHVIQIATMLHAPYSDPACSCLPLTATAAPHHVQVGSWHKSLSQEKIKGSQYF